MLKRFKQNTEGTDYVVGDIHGCFSLLQTKLDELGFNEATDRLFSVGDLVDRGLESEKVLEWLSKPWFHAVLGNHEQMVIDAYEKQDDNAVYLCAVNGGTWFFTLFEHERQSVVDAFNKLPVMIEIDTPDGLVGIIHAQVSLNNWVTTKQDITTPGAFEEDVYETCIWGRTKINRMDETPIHGVTKVYCGHTPTKDVVVLGNQHYIDTGAVYTGKLTVVKI